MLLRLLLLSSLLVLAAGNIWEAQLYEDLMYDYNKNSRPVQNSSQVLKVQFGTALIRIIDIDEKNQVFTTNLWLEMHWFDAKLVWTPEDYNGLQQIHVPTTNIWTPDIVLYNKSVLPSDFAAGDPDIKIYNDAIVHSNGRVVWKPPAIYKSFCAIDVTWFPYDFQTCKMKFGMWSYTGKYVDLRFLPWSSIEHTAERDEYLSNGMDMSYFQTSAEWDLLNLNATRHEVIYSSCCGPEKYVDITFSFHLRRKTLFFTCNLILPCVLISCLTTFVFYLSDKKLTFAISILVTLTVFFLVGHSLGRGTISHILIEIIPPTSVVIPMFGKYLLYTMILLTLSIVISVISVNCHCRTGVTHNMPKWMRRLFLHYLPPLMCMRTPLAQMLPEDEECHAQRELPSIPSFYETRGTIFEQTKIIGTDGSVNVMESSWPPPKMLSASDRQPHRVGRTYSEAHVKCLKGVDERKAMARKTLLNPELSGLRLSVESEDDRQYTRHKGIVLRLMQHVTFISEHFRIAQEQAQHSEEWRFVSKVIDRFFLIVFTFLNLLSLAIILRAPSLWDVSVPLVQTQAESPLSHSRMEL